VSAADRGGRPVVWCLLGPSGTGKTALALELARHHPVEIVSVDSALIYRGMDIGTAKPTAAERRVCPHHLIDIVEPHETYSAARFGVDARKAIEACLARGRTPLLVGGTGLYFRALREGLSALPESDPVLRAELEAALAREGAPALHQRLAAVDPAAAARIHRNDPQRILRALEVHTLTGEPLSLLQARGRNAAGGWHLHRVILVPRDRRAHAEALRRRFEAMLAAGLIEEVLRLRSDPRLHAGLPSMRSVGYRQVLAYLEGRGDRARLEHEVLHATRQLVKRQLTWFRSEPGATWASVATGQDLRPVSLHFLLRLFNLTTPA
jgi:tRNA dimethylallyltransferase